MDFDFDQISDMLGNMSEEELHNLQEAAQSLFGAFGGGEPEEPPGAPPGGQQQNAPGGGFGGFGGFGDMFTPELLAQLSRLMQRMNGHDPRSDLILALKPHLSRKRQRRAEQAVQMMKMMDLLPALRETVLGGGGKQQGGF
ncbi:MAG: hypothetical protein LBS96_02010 [Oscillospiraceae bacterium]|jgi:hypothetical protein|nr:hypothetical protein [Oscillospiraceae bacterium]